MDFRILGPLEVRDRGRPVELRRRKPRTLLGFLLLRPGETVSSDALIDALWGEQPPRTARAALQNYVAQLRRALGPGVVVSEGGGYLLDVSPEQIDLGRFERLTAEARAAGGDDRVGKLREALDLWRGPPLADLAYEPFAALEAPRLEELRTAALEDLVDARLSLGAGPDLVPELEQVVAEYPYRERLRGQLMLALYRAGRQAEALEAYQATRATLVGELGIEPSAALRELEQAILLQDPALEPAAGEPAEEAVPAEERRKTVTILFADLDCPETIDPELLRQATSAELGRVRSVLEGHGATIEQRAGDEVMAAFGIPQAHEDDALRAVRAALDVTESRTTEQAVELRVGIESGEVLAGVDETGHGFATGPAVIVAKRMLQRAGPREVLLGPAALRLLGGAVVVEPAGGGEARILELVEGVSAPARRQGPLVDRDGELEALRAAFGDAVEARRCRLFLLLGEAGIGKTRLATELASELDRSATVLVGRCVSYGKGATFLPLAEIVRQVGEPDTVTELVAGDEHAELISARLADLTGGAEAPASGGETFWAVRRLFESLAAERPLLLVFEDLHWAEPTLLDLLDYFAGQISAAPVLVLGLAREELLETRADWRGTDSTTLAPLSPDEGRELIETLGDVPGASPAEIVRAAGGNPLFIEQLLAHAREGGDPEALPPTLDALLVSRLDRLEPNELTLLQRAALTGREFSREAVAHLLDQDAATIDRPLLAVAKKGLVHPSSGDGFRFHHVLIRDAAYGMLPKAQRAALHERHARWLETRPARSDELVGFHLEQAYGYLSELGPPGPESEMLAAAAGERLAAAGLRAAKIGDTHAASNLLTRSISLLETEEVARRDLLTELALVYWRAGDLQAVEAALRRALAAAESTGDGRAELRARVERAYLKLFRQPEGGAEELLALTAEAIPILEQAGDNRTLGLIWYMLAHVHGGFHCRYGQSAEAAEQALEYYARAGWPVTPCLQELAVSLYLGPVPVGEAVRRCNDLLEQADRGGAAHVLVFRAGLEAMAGAFDEARSLASSARASYEELDWADKVWENYAPIAAEIELLAGDNVEAERLLRESCGRLEAWGEQARLATQAARLGEVLYRQGGFDEAARWVGIAESNAASDDASAQFLWRSLRAKGRAREGGFDEAEALAHEAVEIAAATDAVSPHADVLLDAAEVGLLSGRTRIAIGRAKEAARLLEKKGNVASLERARSLLEQLANA